MKTMPLDSIHSGLLGTSPGVIHRKGKIRYLLSYQVHFDWLPGQYLTVGTYPVPQGCLPPPHRLPEHHPAEWGQGTEAGEKMALWSW